MKETMAPALRNYMIKMRKEDFLKEHFTHIQKVVRWKCPVCWTEHGTKTDAEACLTECRARVLTEQ